MECLGRPQPLAFHEVVACFADARVGNDVLRHSLVLGLSIESLNKLMAEQMPYAWMSRLLAGVLAFQQNNDGWQLHHLAQIIWNVVNEELRARRQRRNLVVPMENQGEGGRLSL